MHETISRLQFDNNKAAFLMIGRFVVPAAYFPHWKAIEKVLRDHYLPAALEDVRERYWGADRSRIPLDTTFPPFRDAEPSWCESCRAFVDDPSQPHVDPNDPSVQHWPGITGLFRE